MSSSATSLETKVLQQKAAHHHRKGELDLTLVYLRRALQCGRSSPDYQSDEVETLRLLGDLYVDMGADQRARRIYKHIIGDFSPAGDETVRVYELIQYCHILIRLSDYEPIPKLMLSLELLLGRLNPTIDRHLYAQHDLLRGFLAYAHNDHEAARQFLEKGLIEYAALTPWTREAVEGLALSALLAENYDHLKIAVERISSALAMTNQLFPVSATTLRVLHLSMRLIQNSATGGLETILPITAQAFSVAERLRYVTPMRVALEGDLERVLDRFYEQSFVACLMLGNPEALFFFSDLSRAPLLRQSLAFNTKDLVARSQLVGDLHSAYRRLSRIRISSQLSEEGEDGAKRDFLNTTEDAEEAIDDAECRLRLLAQRSYNKESTRNIKLTFKTEPKIEASPPIPGTISVSIRCNKLSAPLAISELQRSILDSETAVIQFACRGRIALANVILSSSCESVPLPCSGESFNPWAPGGTTILKDLIEGAYRERIEAVVRNHDSPNRRQSWKEILAQLYRILFEPLEHLLGGISRLVIIPDGPIQYVPLEILISARIGNDELGFSDCRFLCERFTFRYVPSPSIIPFLREGRTRRKDGKSKTRRIGIFADPSCRSMAQSPDSALFVIPRLPSARTEGMSIKELYERAGYSVAYYAGHGATKTAFLSEAARCNLLHIAAHCLVDRSNLWMSRLVLADDPGPPPLENDLRAYEIRTASLIAELVICSACETEVGNYLIGEGLLGLARAFFEAGVPSVIGSLWKVEDESAARFMIALHKHLRAGLPKDKALFNAREELLSSDPKRDPFYWGPFVLVGMP